MFENKITIVVECGNCGEEQAPLVLRQRQLKGWLNGGHIQNVMPELTPAERELLISGYCDNCFKQLVGE